MKKYTKLKTLLAINYIFTVFLFATIFLDHPTPAMFFVLCIILLLAIFIIHIHLFAAGKRFFTKTSELYESYSQEDVPDTFLQADLASQITQIVESAWNACENNYILQYTSKSTDLYMLQNQINPHFLYNTLDSIRWHALHNHAPEVAKMLEILAAYFRYSIDLKDAVVTIYDELKNIKDYFSIQRYRFSDRLNLEIHYETEDVLKASIPKMTLQPLIENAIFHGLERKATDGLITVKIFHTRRTLYVRVQDNGQGIPIEKLHSINEKIENELRVNKNSAYQKSENLALWNINQRIRLFFGQDYGMHLYSTESEGTTVVISLPWINQ